jgi:hypothetical protein
MCLKGSHGKIKIIQSENCLFQPKGAKMTMQEILRRDVGIILQKESEIAID